MELPNMNITPVSLLQDICNSNGVNVTFILLSSEEDNSSEFTYRVEVKNYTETGSAESKKKAKNLAAQKMLFTLMNSNLFIKNKYKNIIQTWKFLDNFDPNNPIDHCSKFIENNSEDFSNSIGELQEKCVKNNWNLPVFKLNGYTGRQHQPQFNFECIIENLNLQANGTGRTKKIAKNDSAKNMLTLLRDKHLNKSEKVLDQMAKNSVADDSKLNGSTMAENNSEDCSNSIGELQEKCARKYWNLPVYKFNGCTGPQHQPQFNFECIIENLNLQANGTGRTKKIAKNDSAKNMLTLLDKNSNQQVGSLCNMDQLKLSNK